MHQQLLALQVPLVRKERKAQQALPVLQDLLVPLVRQDLKVQLAQQVLQDLEVELRDHKVQQVPQVQRARPARPAPRVQQGRQEVRVQQDLKVMQVPQV